MPKQKTIPELKDEIAASERQLAQLRHKQQQLENRAAYYEKGDRRKRAHRLITRGAAIESVAPLAKVLTETEFYAFAEKVRLETEYRDLQTDLTPLYADTKRLWAIHYNIYEVQHEQERQNAVPRQKKLEIEH